MMPDDQSQTIPLAPEDWEKVFEVKFLELGEGGSLADRRRLMTQIIASAVVAERNRCIKIVQKAANTWWVEFSPDAGDLRAMMQEIENG